MINPHTNEQQCLAWIEGELDSEASRIFEQELQRDPELASRVQAMRRDRDLLQSMPVPPVPADLSERVEQAMTRPMLTGDRVGGPGRFRRRTQRSADHANWGVPIRMAALIAIGVGVLVVLVFFSPISRVLTGLHDENMVAHDGDVQNLMVLSDPRNTEAGTDGTMAFDVVVEDPVTPEPLAMVLHSESDVLPRLRELAKEAGGTLIRNASQEDLMEDDFVASSSGAGRPASREPSDAPVLSGDPSMAPSFDDQFRYADAGSVYTIAVPLSKLDELLVMLDDAFGTDGAVLLLQDHLSDANDTDWVRTLRAREAVSTWTRDTVDPIVILPIFQP
jgi:hypothetical protein